MDLKQFDILDYLSNRNIETSYEGKNVSSGWVGVQCPFCDDPSFHLGINLQSKQTNCWRCGPRGSVLKYISAIEKCSTFRAKEIVAKYLNLDLLYHDEKVEGVESVEFTKDISKNFPGGAYQYLAGRNFDPDYLLNKYDLYFGGLIGDYKFRIIIPVNFKNKLVTFTARDYTEKAFLSYKHLSKEKSVIPIKSTLYNLDNTDDRAILVEGVFDVWRFGDGAIASFGTEVTDEQKILLKSFSRLFIMFDSDATDKANSLSDQLAPFIPEVYVIEMKEGDPCNLSKEEAEEIKRDLIRINL